jgi:hypothetical protein
VKVIILSSLWSTQHRRQDGRAIRTVQNVKQTAKLKVKFPLCLVNSEPRFQDACGELIYSCITIELGSRRK